MAGGKIYKDLKGEELEKQLQDVSEKDVAYLENLRENGGANTKELLEKFGREKLGIELNKSFKTDKLLDEAILPGLKKRLGIKEKPAAPITSVVTPESIENPNTPIAEDIPTSEANEVISDVIVSDSPVLSPEYREPPKQRPVKAGKHFLKNIETTNVFEWTPALAKLNHMYACTKDGKLMSEM